MQRSALKSALKPVLTAVLGVWLLLPPGPALARDEPQDGDAGEAAEAAEANDPDFALSSAGDAKKGKRVFGRCRACHGVTSSGAKPGPSLENIFGRPAGTAPGYTAYSKALRESGIVWNERTLDKWISNPLDFLPGNKMNLAPIRSAQDRMDLLAYLRQETERP